MANRNCPNCELPMLAEDQCCQCEHKDWPWCNCAYCERKFYESQEQEAMSDDPK